MRGGGGNYSRPKKTQTQMINEAGHNAMSKKLEGYVGIRNDELVFLDFRSMPIHVRYITVIEDKPMFRMGGFLIKVMKDYVVLSNREIKWSVQLNDNCHFFRKLSSNELLKRDLEQKAARISELEKDNQMLRNVLERETQPSPCSTVADSVVEQDPYSPSFEGADK